MMSSQRSDTERNNLIEKVTKIGTGEVIKHYEIINKKFEAPNVKKWDLIV